jgi:hypothetical protein
MSKRITVIHVNNRFYIPGHNQMQEIPLAVVNAWREEGEDVSIKEVESYE